MHCKDTAMKWIPGTRCQQYSTKMEKTLEICSTFLDNIQTPNTGPVLEQRVTQEVKSPCILLNACKRETNITLWVVEGFWHLTLFVLRCLEPNQSKVCRVCWTSCKHHDPPSLHPSSESNQIKSLLKSCCVLPRQTEFTEPQNHLHTKSVTSFRWMKFSLVKNSTHQGIANSSFRIPKDYYSQVYSDPEGRCSQWVGSISSWHLSFVVLQPPTGILEHWQEFRRLQSSDLARGIKMKKWARLIQKLIQNPASKSVALCPVGDKEVLHSYR